MSNRNQEPIRLTNRTARNLRLQAKQQRNALYLLAVVASVALCALAVILGIAHLIAVPLIVLCALALDALLLLFARGRYLSLTAQAICTEAAARQLQGGMAEEKRAAAALRDLERIKRDLSMTDSDDDEEDEDVYARHVNHEKPLHPQHIQSADEEQPTRQMPPAKMRRRQARLQVITSDTPDNRAN